MLGPGLTVLVGGEGTCTGPGDGVDVVVGVASCAGAAVLGACADVCAVAGAEGVGEALCAGDDVGAACVDAGAVRPGVTGVEGVDEAVVVGAGVAAGAGVPLGVARWLEVGRCVLDGVSVGPDREWALWDDLVDAAVLDGCPSDCSR